MYWIVASCLAAFAIALCQLSCAETVGTTTKGWLGVGTKSDMEVPQDDVLGWPSAREYAYSVITTGLAQS